MRVNAGVMEAVRKSNQPRLGKSHKHLRETTYQIKPEGWGEGEQTGLVSVCSAIMSAIEWMTQIRIMSRSCGGRKSKVSKPAWCIEVPLLPTSSSLGLPWWIHRGRRSHVSSFFSFLNKCMSSFPKILLS